MKSSHIIWSDRPSEDWTEGYPIGNGRLGAMVLGDPFREVISLNHDRLWREFWKYQDHNLAPDLPEIRKLISQGRWEDAHDLIIKKVPITGLALYVNPFVPACDLGIYTYPPDKEVTEYRRCLDMDSAIAEVSYTAEKVKYRREHLVSWPDGVIAIRLSAEQAARVRAEISLSRLLDPDCRVTGSSWLGENVLEGEFEEGVRFAAVTRVIQRGGRLTNGLTEYVPPPGEMPKRDLGGLQFIFREKGVPAEPCGVSTCVDCADEALILTVIGTQDESRDPVDFCMSRLDSIPADFEKIKAGHVRDHRKLYRRVSLDLKGPKTDKTQEEIIEKTRKTGNIPASIFEGMFNLCRYLAIASGRPQPKGQPAKAPINLQGIWNQDRRPAWDCDYHTDLNVEMCYWPLDMANLSELLPPLADWMHAIMPEARQAAKDLYGTRGLYIAVCDLRHVGNADDLGFAWTGGAAWVTQMLWQHWEYTGDLEFLKKKVYPLLKEIGYLYEDHLVEDSEGRLVPIPNASPEMGIKGRKRYSSISSPSTIDLELIRESLTNLIAASEILGADKEERPKWKKILGKVPMPVIDEDGCLQEWLEKHEPIDPHHRHRSPFIGLSSGDRITAEDTPEYLEAARKLLAVRQSDRKTTCALACVWDAQLLARLYEGDAALAELNIIGRHWLMGNLTLSFGDWREDSETLNWFPGHRLFQIEACIGLISSIAEMFFQDRRGLLRLLPALPKAWPDGEIKGLRSRGGFEVNIRWKNGKLQEAEILSLRGNPCRLKTFPTAELSVTHNNRKIKTTHKDGVLEFKTEAGESYNLS